MRVLVIDVGSNALDFCMRCLAAGHEVKWFDKNRKDGTRRRAGEGIVDKITDYVELQTKWVHWADLIFTPDNTHYVDMLEPYRLSGYPIFGCNLEAQSWELDRQVGQDVMKECGISVMESKTFYDYKDAIAFVKKNHDMLVSKPSGDGDRALSYVANNAADLVFMMQRWASVPKYVASARTEGFIVQRKLEGVEFAVSGVFGPHGFNEYFFENAERKKIANGDLGLTIGEAGTLVKAVKKSRMADMTLRKAEKELHRIGYVGFVDLNAMITPEGDVYPFEWSCRPGWPIFHNISSLVVGDMAQMMLDCVNGKDTMKVKTDMSVSVVMTLPDFPFSRFTNKELCGYPIRGVQDNPNIHLSEVMVGVAPVMVGEKIVEIPTYVTAGDYALVATAEAPTILEAGRKVYKTLKEVKIPNSPSYRTDIANGKIKKELPTIQALGFATEWVL